MAEKPRTPSIAISLLPVVTLVIMLAVAIYIFRGDSLGGASQIVLLIATSICSLIAVFHCKIKWEDIEGQIARNIYGIAPSVIILLLIGTLSGAIISGAYFGDKMSPLSDTTVLAASVTDTPLFTHIRYMLYTTVPSMIVTLIVFSIAGFSREAADASQIAAFSEALKGSFHITPWLMIVPIVTGIMIAKKTPSIVVLFASSILAGIFALIFQPNALLEISGITDSGIIAYIKGLLMTFYDSTQIQTGNEALNSLVSTRGMAGMMNTIWLIICAMCFGGAMSASGMLESITRIFLHFMRGRTSMVASTVVSGLSLNICTADQFIAIILNSEMFKEVYKQRGFESRLLSRTTEDSVTVTSVLIPWTTCGMTQSTILGVSTWTYFPYCVFNIVSPFMSILIAATGYKIVQKTVK